MTTHDRSTANLNGLVETTFSSMREVYHHTYTIHLMNSLTPHTAESTMLGIAACRVAQIIVAIMAERHIHYTATTEVFDTLDVITYGISVLYSKH